MTKSARKTCGILLLVFLTLVSCFGFYQLIRFRCFLWTCVPSRNFTVFALELPSDFFPDGAIVNALHPSSESFGALETGSMTVYWESGQGLAVYNVLRFGSEGGASKFYRGLTTLGDPFPERDGLTFESEFADEFALGCGDSEFGGYRCSLRARYKEFALSFNSIIDEEMTRERFEEIVRFIDAQMVEHLNLEEKK